MNAFYDTIILSPHLDDAALSCGGQIYLKTAVGQSVLIVTIMAGDPPASGLSTFAQSLHDRWQLNSQAAAQRRDEDIVAASILGADTLHWTVADCIYRQEPQTGESYYRSEQAIFGELNPAESLLVNKLAEHLTTLPQTNQIIAPLGIGNHVDHQITRLAAEQEFGENLGYYEEYPYAIAPGAVEVLTIEKSPAWQAQTIPISEEALFAKIEAIAAYVSQLSTFFLDLSDLEHQVRQYVQTVGGERIWHHSSLPNPDYRPVQG